MSVWFELKVSEQDANCQRTGDLTRTVTQAQTHAQTTAAGLRTADLTHLHDLRTAALRRATPSARP
ncbi:MULTISPECIES: hypothetical protein [unclassified Streptomyces]|uniref:hypothetical protein n=1 Tax=unclassified Streptomyces TaxID=2593676 RepID=UPI00344DA4E6